MAGFIACARSHAAVFVGILVDARSLLVGWYSYGELSTMKNANRHKSTDCDAEFRNERLQAFRDAVEKGQGSKATGLWLPEELIRMVEAYVKLHGDEYGEKQWRKVQSLRDEQCGDYSYSITWQLQTEVQYIVSDVLQIQPL